MSSPFKRVAPNSRLFSAAAAFLGLAAAFGAAAKDYSFTGTFAKDDDVLLFKIRIAAGATMTARSYSYAGGVNAAGQTIARGGFDPILALATAERGLVFLQQDDGPEGTVPADPATGQAWDVFFQGRQAAWAPGDYTLIVLQFDDFPKSFYLANRFEHSGKPTFTAALPGPACESGQFKDASAGGGKDDRDDDDQDLDDKPGTAHCRDGHWALDILNVVSAEQVESVPTLLSAGTVTTGAPPAGKKGSVSANLPIPYCLSVGLNAVEVDEEGRMLPEPDCVKRVDALPPPPADEAEPKPPAIGLVEVDPVAGMTPAAARGTKGDFP